MVLYFMSDSITIAVSITQGVDVDCVSSHRKHYDAYKDDEVDYTCKGEFLVDVDSSLSSVVVDGGYLDDGSSDSCFSSSYVVEDNIFSMWGVNLHHDDNRIIFFIKKKFSLRLGYHLRKFFSCMLFNGDVILPSGKAINNSPWSIISNEVLPIAMKSVESIVEEQNKELEKFLSNARIVDVDKDNFSSCVTRKITDNEKSDLMIHAKEFTRKRLIKSIRILWADVFNNASIGTGYGYKETYNCVYGIGTRGSWGVKLRYRDNIAVLNARREFSSRIRAIVYHKYSDMAKNKHEFDDGTSIDIVGWVKVSKRLIPIAKCEVKHIIDEERKVLEEIVSMARVVVGSGVDREIMSGEKSIVLENIMKLVSISLKTLFRRVWYDVVYSLGDVSVVRHSVEFAGYNVGCVGSSKVKLCYEDDRSILNIRKEFSSEFYRYVSNKFSKIIEQQYKLDDGTPIGMYPWRKISKKLLPIVKREIKPIMENERMRINDVLLKSRVDISLRTNDSRETKVTRELTSDERFAVLEIIMKSVYKNATTNLGQLWNRIVRLPSIAFLDLREVDRSGLDGIRLEFIGNMAPIVYEVIAYPSSGVLTDPSSDTLNIISERSNRLFKEGGFFNRVESVLSCAQVVDSLGNSKFINSEERNYVLQEFQYMIDADIDCLIKKRTRKINSFSVVDLSSGLLVDGGVGDKWCGKIRTVTDNGYFVGDEHSYAKSIV